MREVVRLVPTKQGSIGSDHVASPEFLNLIHVHHALCGRTLFVNDGRELFCTSKIHTIPLPEKDLHWLGAGAGMFWVRLKMIEEKVLT